MQVDQIDAAGNTGEGKCASPTQGPENCADVGVSAPVSMHERVAVWCDCCSCAAEPYWLEVAEELGIDLDDD